MSFEYSVDEAIAFQLDFLKATKEGSSWRRREQWQFAISFIVIIASLLVFVTPDRSPGVVGALIAFTVIVGAFLAVLFGRYYDHLVKTRLRRLMIEQLGGSGPCTCSIEIRPEGLWVAQPGVEMIFPWRDARKVDDTAEGITVTFAGGGVLARTRGFTSQEHRSGFLGGVRKYVSAVSQPAA